MTLRFLAPVVVGSAMFAGDWTTFSGDAQRTAWARNEQIITKQNVGKMKLLWSLKLENTTHELTSLTTPIVAVQLPTQKGFHDYVIVAGSSDVVYAVEADEGKIVWQRKLPLEGTPKVPQTDWLCPNALNATPHIDKRNRTLYVLASDGRLHSLNIINGGDKAPPIRFVPPYAKTWSLNLLDGFLYTSVSQGCNGVRSAVYAVNVDNPNHPVTSFISSPTGGAGIWGRAGVAITSEGKVVAETGDGTYDAAQGKFTDSFLGLQAKTLKMIDYYTPANRAWITKKDLDMGNMSPIVFKFKDWELVAGAGKEGVIYLLDAKKLGGEDHRTPLFRSPLYTNEDADFASRGFWGSMATMTDSKGDVWLYAPAWGAQTSSSPKFPITYDDTPHGSIMAFKLDVKDGKPVLVPAWRSRNLGVPEPPVVANGVVFVVSSGENTRQVNEKGGLYSSKERAEAPLGNAVLYALDAGTGKELFSSGKTMKSFTHFGGVAVSDGRAYVTTWDNTVYAFSVPQD